MSTLGDAADVNPVIKFLPHTLHMRGSTIVQQRSEIRLETYELPCIRSYFPWSKRWGRELKHLPLSIAEFKN